MVLIVVTQDLCQCLVNLTSIVGNVLTVSILCKVVTAALWIAATNLILALPVGYVLAARYACRMDTQVSLAHRV